FRASEFEEAPRLETIHGEGAVRELGRGTPEVASAITTTGGAPLAVSTATVTPDGVGWIDVGEVRRLKPNAPWRDVAEPGSLASRLQVGCCAIRRVGAPTPASPVRYHGA